LDANKYHPILEDNKHPILEDNKHPILYDNKYHPILEDNIHPILYDNKYHPILEDKKHPILDDYCINSSLYREMSNNRPHLDENVRSVNIQKWNLTIPDTVQPLILIVQSIFLYIH